MQSSQRQHKKTVCTCVYRVEFDKLNESMQWNIWHDWLTRKWISDQTWSNHFPLGISIRRTQLTGKKSYGWSHHAVQWQTKKIRAD